MVRKVTHRPVNAEPFVQSGSNWTCFILRFDKFDHIPTEQKTSKKKLPKKIKTIMFIRYWQLTIHFSII